MKPRNDLYLNRIVKNYMYLIDGYSYVKNHKNIRIKMIILSLGKAYLHLLVAKAHTMANMAMRSKELSELVILLDSTKYTNI